MPKPIVEMNSSLEKLGIKDDPERGLLEFWVAGYTQKDSVNNVSRQKHHEIIHGLMAAKNITQTVDLIHEPTNHYDKNAIRVMATVSAKDENPTLVGANIGYVPKQLAAQLIKKMKKVKEIKILYSKNGIHDKYYNCKIGVFYTDKHQKKVATFSQQDLLRSRKIARLK